MKNNLKEKFDNGVKFVKDHKWEILIGAGTIAAGVVTGKAINNKIDKKLELYTQMGYMTGLDVGINAVCKQQNLNAKDICNNELAGIIKDFISDDERLREMAETAYNIAIENVTE